MLVARPANKAIRVGRRVAGPPTKRGRTARGVADDNLAAFRRAVLSGLMDLKGRASLADIAAEMLRGRQFDILQMFGIEGTRVVGDSPEFGAMLRIWRRVFEDSAMDNLARSPSLFRRLGLLKITPEEAEAALGFKFDIFNPESVAFIQSSEFLLVRGINRRSRDGLRTIMSASFQDGIPPASSARRIRQIVGLTPKQAEMVINFRRALTGGRGAAPSRSVLARQLRDHRFDPTVLRAIDRGIVLTAAQRERMVARFAERLLAFRANNIARTETIRAANAGQQALWDQMVQQRILIPEEMRRIWIVTQDDRLCPICEPIPGLNAGGVGMDVPFITPVGELMHPPAHPQCLPSDTLISASGISATSERWFEGNLVVIRTAEGKQLRCTPNHPILTDHGWIAAELLDVGDDVIGGDPSQRIPSLIDHDSDDVPTRIQEITEAFGRSRGVASREVPVAAPDFHGDGVGSEVAIIRAKGHLSDGLDSAMLQHLAQCFFVVGHERFGVCCSRHSGAAQGLEAAFYPQRGLVGGLDLVSAFSGAHEQPLVLLGLALPSQAQSVVSQPGRQGFPGDPENGSELVDRLAGQISLDQIVWVGRVPFKGHVYNLQTESGWFVSNGIITHNCRCDMALIRIAARGRSIVGGSRAAA